MSRNNLYAKEFDDFLKIIYDNGGLEGLANHLPFITTPFIVTSEGIIQAVNEKYVRTMGYSREELYGKQILDFAYDADRQSIQKNIQEDLTGTYNVRLITKGGAIKEIIVYPYLFRVDGKKYRLTTFIDNSELVALQRKQIDDLNKTAAALAGTIERRDPYTFGHMNRTARIAVEIAKLLSLDDQTIDAISVGASLHDIGKIAVPIEILVKPARLEAHEWEFIKIHPVVGHQLLSGMDYMNTIKDILLLHHEHQDGSGYPNGLRNDEISIEVAIVTVADCMEAISGVRPYRRSYSFDDAIDIMKKESHKFHPGPLQAVESLLKSGSLSGKEFGLH